MKLTEQDKKTLLGRGYLKSDMKQLEEAAARCEYVNNKNDRYVSAEWVIRMLGRETWLNGLGRAAFHWTCSRENNGHSIHFDCSRMFKQSTN